MPPSHLLLALAVVFVWGTNFAVIKLGLGELPPLTFATLRFAASALPWLLFVRRPPIAWRYLAAFGVCLGPGQFGLLFLAMRGDISPGLASLVVQVQVFFTVGLSLWWFGERLQLRHLAGLALAVAGLAVIGAHTDRTTTLRGIALVVAAALCWSLANLTVKQATRRHGTFDLLGFMVWSSAFAAPALLVIALVAEGAGALRGAVAHASAGAWAAVAWQAIGNTLFGYGAWNWLLARHPAATVTPAALLVPVFGFAASSLVLGEALPAWKLLAGALVLTGLAVNLLGQWPKREAAVPVVAGD